MEYYIGDKRKHIKFDYYIAEGEEGTVSRFGREVIKIYWENVKESSHPFLNLNTAERMTKIRSNHILLPRRIVYNYHDEFVGYSTKHIDGFYGDKEFSFNYERERYVIDNMLIFLLSIKINKIYKEIYYLSNIGIILSDINVLSNYIFNGQFWLIDPGCYMFSSLPKNKILKMSIEKANEFFVDQIFQLSDQDIMLLGTILDNNLYTIPEILKLNGNSFEKTKKYILRLKKLK